MVGIVYGENFEIIGGRYPVMEDICRFYFCFVCFYEKGCKSGACIHLRVCNKKDSRRYKI